MFELFDSNDIVASAAKLREMTRTTAVGEKINVHVITAAPEPKPDFEAMRRLVAGPVKKEKVATQDDDTKA